MKVIKKGRPQKGWSKKYKCTGSGNGGGGCGAVLLVEEGDLFETSSGHYDGSTDYYTTFQCIECGVKTDIKDCPIHVTRKTPPPMPEEIEAERLRINAQDELASQ
jgi:hypothetical protein